MSFKLPACNLKSGERGGEKEKFINKIFNYILCVQSSIFSVSILLPKMYTKPNTLCTTEVFPLYVSRIQEVVGTNFMGAPESPTNQRGRPLRPKLVRF